MANGKLTGFVFAKHNVQMFALAECIFKTAVRDGGGRVRWCEELLFYFDCISYLVQ